MFKERDQMRKALFAVVAVSMLSGCTTENQPGPAERPIKAISDLRGDYVALHGRWVVIHAEQQRYVLTSMNGNVFVFNGNTFCVLGDKGFEIYEIDERHSPKHTNFIGDESVIRGIYELQKDTLRICTAPAGRRRPTNFKTSF
jgi:uncharacterized protein (TIGR03067 family)